MTSWLTCLACGSVDVTSDHFYVATANEEVPFDRMTCDDCGEEHSAMSIDGHRAVDDVEGFAYLTSRGVELLQANLAAADEGEDDGWDDVREHASVSSDAESEQRFMGYFGGA